MDWQPPRFLVRRGGLGITIALIGAGVIATAVAAERIVWKPVALAVLKVDGRPAKIWEVYVAQKQEHLVLVQLGRRNLVLDTELREVVEIPLAALQRKGRDFEWQRQDQSTAETQRAQREDAEKRTGQEAGAPKQKVLATEDWSIRDAGRARIIRVRLKEEGRLLEVQLPLRPDLRILY